MTSDDSFETDDSGVKDGILQREEEKKAEYSPEKAKDLERLEKCLSKNKPTTKLNIFNRRSVYINASFNDWAPIEMKTSYEVRTEKAMTGDNELANFIEKSLIGMGSRTKQIKAKRKEENVV